VEMKVNEALVLHDNNSEKQRGENSVLFRCHTISRVPERST
jgi:hypothetical protein